MTLSNYLVEHEKSMEKRYTPGPMEIVDYDVRHKGIFQLPSAIKEVSLAHILTPPSLPPNLDPRSGVSDYLLLSEDGCITQTHTDFTGSDVCYIVVRGKKVFHIACPTQANMAVFDEWAALDNRR
jgi:hypothetical protein